MKKLMSLLLAGVAIIALSGCSDKVGEAEDYAFIPDLPNGYEIIGILDEEDELLIQFCRLSNNDDYYITVINGFVNDDGYLSVIHDPMINFESNLHDPDWYTLATDGPTPGKLKIGEEYEFNDEDGSSKPGNYWMIESITKIDRCTIDL